MFITTGIKVKEYGSILFGSGTVTNLCFTTVGASGDSKGYEFGLFGGIEPDRTTDGKLIYAMIYDNVAKTGRINIGDAGNEQIENSSTIVFENDTASISMVLNWNSTNLRYEGFDQELVDWFEAQTAPICMAAYSIPDLVIDYNMNLEFGTGV